MPTSHAFQTSISSLQPVAVDADQGGLTRGPEEPVAVDCLKSLNIVVPHAVA